MIKLVFLLAALTSCSHVKDYEGAEKKCKGLMEREKLEELDMESKWDEGYRRGYYSGCVDGSVSR